MNITHKITMRGTMPDGARIQIEDWSAVYPGLSEPYTVAAYPKSRATLAGAFAPKAGESFRAGFTFPTMRAAEAVYNSLVSGAAELRDYAEYLERRDYAPCLG